MASPLVPVTMNIPDFNGVFAQLQPEPTPEQPKNAPR
jgi:hypothetical protein